MQMCLLCNLNKIDFVAAVPVQIGMGLFANMV